MFHFISQNDHPSKVEKRAVRSQAMKNFRRRQRENRQTDVNGNDAKGRCSERWPISSAKLKTLMPIAPSTPVDLWAVCPKSVRTGAAHPWVDSGATSEFSAHPSGPHSDVDDGDKLSELRGRGLSIDIEFPTTETTELLCSVATQRTPSLQAPQAFRDQFYQAFISSYYAEPIISANHQFIAACHWLTPRSLAMDAARAALSLTHLGTYFHDWNLLKESQKIHCEALQLIRRELQKPEAVADDCILGACYTVAHCQIYPAISGLVSEKGGSNSMKHLNCLTSLISLVGQQLASSHARIILSAEQARCKVYLLAVCASHLP